MSKQLSVGLAFSAFSLLFMQRFAVADGPGSGAPAAPGMSNGQAFNSVQPGMADRQRLGNYPNNNRSPVTPREADRQRLNTYYNGDWQEYYQGFDQSNYGAFRQGYNYGTYGQNGRWNNGFMNGASPNYYGGVYPYSSSMYDGTNFGYGNNNGGTGYNTSYNWSAPGNGYFYDSSRFGNYGYSWFGNDSYNGYGTGNGNYYDNYYSNY